MVGLKHVWVIGTQMRLNTASNSEAMFPIPELCNPTCDLTWPIDAYARSIIYPLSLPQFGRRPAQLPQHLGHRRTWSHPRIARPESPRLLPFSRDAPLRPAANLSYQGTRLHCFFCTSRLVLFALQSDHCIPLVLQHQHYDSCVPDHHRVIDSQSRNAPSNAAIAASQLKRTSRWIGPNLRSLSSRPS